MQGDFDINFRRLARVRRIELRRMVLETTALPLSYTPMKSNIKIMAGKGGFEPPTYAFKVRYSAGELLPNKCQTKILADSRGIDPHTHNVVRSVFKTVPGTFRDHYPIMFCKLQQQLSSLIAGYRIAGLLKVDLSCIRFSTY